MFQKRLLLLTFVLLVPQCPSETYDVLHKSTKDFPDEVVSFIRQHQLMWEPVLPLSGRPVLTRINVSYMLKKVVVDRVDTEDGTYDVLHLGTGEGQQRCGDAVDAMLINGRSVSSR